MHNITEFNRACKAIFSALYDEFPVPIDITPEGVGFIEEFDIHEAPRVLFGATMCFLADEQFIIYDRGRDNMHLKSRARLTAKGLARLQRMPEGIQPQASPLIDRLRIATNSIGDQVSKTATSETVSQVLKLIFA
ncbi:MAG: hypothetical protein KBF48_13620 [Xanthomonadales bacterium]|nr:hypothetical protein [Xanthomonadales bacterium]